MFDLNLRKLSSQYGEVSIMVQLTVYIKRSVDIDIIAGLHETKNIFVDLNGRLYSHLQK